MGLNKDQLEKIKAVRNFGYPKENEVHRVGSGFSYLGCKRALEEANWDVEKAIEMLRDNRDYGRFIVK